VTQDLRIGVIGLGFGANHARILREMPGVSLAAVADTDPGRRALYEGTDVRTYADHAAMLTTERLDAAVVALPASLHAEVALAALDVRCALLVEKPLATNYRDAKLVVVTAQDKGVPLMPGHIERFNPAVVELTRRVQSGEAGRVFEVSARRMSAMRAGPHGNRLPPTDVNVIHDSAIHDVDAIRSILGLEVESVFGVSQSGIVTPAEDGISAILRFESDGKLPAPVASLDVNWLSPRRVRDLTVVGEHGTFVVDYATQCLSLYRTPGEAAIEISVSHHDQLEAELNAFVTAVQIGSPVPVSAKDGLAAVAIADALTLSARTGQPVSIEAVTR
jgi:UDP-N-acetylglucosamine 3-dehydrogenase